MRYHRGNIQICSPSRCKSKVPQCAFTFFDLRKGEKVEVEVSVVGGEAPRRQVEVGRGLCFFLLEATTLGHSKPIQVEVEVEVTPTTPSLSPR